MRKHLTTIAAVVLLSLLIVTPGLAKRAPVWRVPGDFATIQDAIDSAQVADGDTIHVGRGNHAGALVDKSVEIVGQGGATIDDGPLHPAGLTYGFRLLEGSDGATISHLRFDNVDLAIMNGGAVDDVTVSHNEFVNAIQAVSNWRGSGWTISHNDIVDLRTRCGGGIGVLVADFSGGIVMDNVVEHNKVSGTLHVADDDCGGYAGTGIVLYADFRGGRAGAEEIKDNTVTHNDVSLVSDNSDLVPAFAFELTDTRDDPEADPFPVVFDNAIGFNDFRGSDNYVALTPPELADYNTISRNLGADDNRGHGAHPSAFK